MLDTTNPIKVGNGPPKNGVLEYFTSQNESLMERLQRKAPAARFVKAFSCVGNTVMVNPSFGARPSMFICGNSTEAKAEASSVLEQFGWRLQIWARSKALAPSSRSVSCGVFQASPGKAGVTRSSALAFALSGRRPRAAINKPSAQPNGAALLRVWRRRL